MQKVGQKPLSCHFVYFFPLCRLVVSGFSMTTLWNHNLVSNPLLDLAAFLLIPWASEKHSKSLHSLISSFATPLHGTSSV